MPWFLTRIVLHDAPSLTYELLHSHMEVLGFQRYVEVGNARFPLPTTEYLIDTNLSKEEVRTLAEEAAAMRGFKYAVEVVEIRDSRALARLASP